MHTPIRPVLPLAVAMAVIAGAASLPAAADPAFPATDGPMIRQPLVPLDDAVGVPPAPGPLERAERQARDAWTAASAAALTAGAAAGKVAGDMAAPMLEKARLAAGEVLDTAAPLLDAAGERAGRMADGAGALAVEAGAAAEDLAASLHARTAELRAHPVVEAAADVGILLRVVEVIGIGALVGALAWKKLRGA